MRRPIDRGSVRHRLHAHRRLAARSAIVLSVLAATDRCRGDAFSVIFSIPSGDQSKNYYWDQWFSRDTIASDDVTVQNELPDSTTVTMRKSEIMGSLSIDTPVALWVQPDGDNVALSLNSGTLNIQGGGLVNNVSLFFLAPGYVNLQDTSASWLDSGPIEAPDGLTITGTPAKTDGTASSVINLDAGGILSTPHLSVPSGEVDSWMDYSVGSITVGDGIGDASEAVFSDISAHTSIFGVTVNSDATYEVGATQTNLTSLQLNGGSVMIDGPLTLPALVKASPGLLTSTDGKHTSVIESTLYNWRLSTVKSANLGGRSVEFNVTSANGSSEGLEIQTQLINGSIVKTGDGIMTLAFDTPNQQSSTAIDDGGIRMAMTNNAAAIPTSITIGDGTGSIGSAYLLSGGSDQIADTAPITINTDGKWDTGTFTETIGSLTLGGGEITGSGTVTLGTDLTVSANSAAQASSITANLSLNSTTRTFNVAHSDNAAVDLNLGGVISNGTLVLSGSGTTQFSGSADNQQSQTQITSGTTLFKMSSGHNAVGSDLIVGATNDTTSGPLVQWAQSNQLPDSMTVKFRSGTLDLNGQQETITGINASGSGTMDVTTEAGTLTLTGTSTGFAAASVSFNGNLDFAGGAATFDARGGSGGSDPNFTNFVFSGAINNGTFDKTDIGSAQFNGVTGNAILNMIGGTAIMTGGNTLGGLTGSASVQLSTNDLDLNVGTATSLNYTGVISGSGNLVKLGAGTQTLAGFSSNTFTGKTTVQAGALELNKPNGTAVGGDVEIDAAGRLDTLDDNQFTSTTNITNSGTLNLNGHTQHIATLTSTNAAVDNGTIYSTGNIRATNTLLNTLTMYAGGGLIMSGASEGIDLKGTFAGDSTISAASEFSVFQDDPTSPVMTFSSGVAFGDGSKVSLLPTTPDSPAMILVDSLMIIGQENLLSQPPTMTGKLTVDLSAAGTLPNGTYNLIDFSNAPWFLSNYATMASFNTVADPASPGTFSIQNHVLEYTAVPEPATAAMLALAGFCGFSRRSRKHAGLAT